MKELEALYQGRSVIVELESATVLPGDYCLNSQNEVVQVSQSTCVLFEEKIVNIRPFWMKKKIQPIED